MGTEWSQEETSHSYPQEGQLRTQNTQEAKPIGEVSVEIVVEEDLGIVVEEDLRTIQLKGSSHGPRRNEYWEKAKSNSKRFFLSARDLLITWADDRRFWHWQSKSETSEEPVEVAELIGVCWLEIHARFDTNKLTPGILYQVNFIVMLKDPAYGWDIPVNLRLKLADGTKQEHKENLMIKPRWSWIEIPVGKFKATKENAGEMECSMYEYEGGKWKRGLVIKGLAIEPKN